MANKQKEEPLVPGNEAEVAAIYRDIAAYRKDVVEFNKRAATIDEERKNLEARQLELSMELSRELKKLIGDSVPRIHGATR